MSFSVRDDQNNRGSRFSEKLDRSKENRGLSPVSHVPDCFIENVVCPRLFPIVFLLPFQKVAFSNRSIFPQRQNSAANKQNKGPLLAEYYQQSAGSVGSRNNDRRKLAEEDNGKPTTHHPIGNAVSLAERRRRVVKFRVADRANALLEAKKTLLAIDGFAISALGALNGGRGHRNS